MWNFKTISKDVLEAFDTGTLGLHKKHLSKKEQEELRKKVITNFNSNTNKKMIKYEKLY